MGHQQRRLSQEPPEPPRADEPGAAYVWAEVSRINRNSVSFRRVWVWGGQGSNLRPRDYESPALTAELPPPVL